MILQIYLLFIFVRVSQSDWVDPDEYGPSRTRNQRLPDPSSCDCGEALSQCRERLAELEDLKKTPDPDCNSRLYLKRFINLFLINLNDEIPHDTTKELSLQVKLSGKDISILRQFGKDEVHLAEVDHIISNLFHPSWKTVEFYESVFSPFKNVFQFIASLSPSMVAGAACLFIFIYFLWLIRIMSYKKAFGVLAFLIFIVSFGLKWEHKRQEKLVEILANEWKYENIPEECLNKQGFWSKIMGEGDSETCEKYLKTLHINPALSISIPKVISEVIFDFILHPLSFLLESVLGIIKTISHGYPPIVKGIVHAVMSIVGLCVIAYIFVKISTSFLQVVGSLIWSGMTPTDEAPEIFTLPNLGVSNMISKGPPKKRSFFQRSMNHLGDQPGKEQTSLSPKSRSAEAIFGASQSNEKEPGSSFFPGNLVASAGSEAIFGASQSNEKEPDSTFSPGNLVVSAGSSSSSLVPSVRRKPPRHKWFFKAKQGKRSLIKVE